MSPPVKKSKTSEDSLENIRNQINKIKAEAFESENELLEEREDNEDPFIEKEPTSESSHAEIKKLVEMSENRINERLNRIERKLDRILERRGASSEIEEEEHLVEFEEEPNRMTSDSDKRIFPINDEYTFDWFFQNLKDDEYRNSLINRRWNLTRNVNTKTINIAVKEFLKMHFELAICVKYSCSGYGSHGTKKKKLDTKSLGVFVFECFNSGFPGAYTFSDITKAIVQFWGRAQDTLNKANERCIKRENL